MPHYITGFILASNIQIFYPGLGSLEQNNEMSELIHILMKYAYAQVLTGSIGPFSFDLSTEYSHNYQIKRKNGGISITLPGGQIIAYVMTTLPKFPGNQSNHFDPLPCDLHQSETSHSRKKRSISDDYIYKSSVNIKQLARSMFSEGLQFISRHDELGENESISTKYIKQILRDSEAKREKLSKFLRKEMDSISATEVPLSLLPSPPSVNNTMEDLNY